MLIYYVIVPILIAVFLYFFSDKIGRVIAIVAQSLFVLGAFYLLFLTQNGYIITNVGSFRSFLGVYLMADALAAVFILLSSVIFLAAAVFSINEKRSSLFWFLLFIWESALIGLFLTRDFFNIFVMAEVATVVVAVLLMYDRDRRRIYDGMIFLMTNVVAIQFYLFGVGYIYMITGRMDMLAAAEIFRELPSYQIYLAYALIMTAIAFKCALLPLSSWFVKVSSVPRAPIAIATILSALHVKGGIYLFIRFQEIFGELIPSEFYLIIGVITGIIGVIMALTQKDIMLILAYSSVAQIGLIMIGLNMGTNYAYIGALYHIVNHAIFKGALFFGAGMISQAYNVRNINQIRGVWQRDKVFSIAQFMAILGIIGAPFFNGSISKYFITTEASIPLTIAIIAINLGTILVYLKYISVFRGKTSTTNPYLKDGYGQGVVIVLGILCLFFGVFGQWILNFLFGFNLQISINGYIEKIIIFFVSLGIGLLISRYTAPINEWLENIGIRINWGFRGICASIGVFFGLILIVARFM